MSNELDAVRIGKLNVLRQQGEAYPNDFCRSDLAESLISEHGAKESAELNDDLIEVAVAGRIMLYRRMGKAAFISLQDMSGRIQIYFNNKTLDAASAKIIDELDLGDIVGIKGALFKTQTDELTVRAASVRLLSKSLHPLPEKYHGMTDATLRYRHRYISLIANPGEREIFTKRAAIVRYLRDFFHGRGYMEVETPILQNIPGGALARPFVTHCHALDSDFYLRIAQELYLKRLIVGGIEQVFEINRNFRNEGISPRHNPEFTMLEFNAAYQTCEDYIALTETLLHSLVVHIAGKEEISYQGQTISFKRPFARVSPLAAIENARPEWSRGELQDRHFILEKLLDSEGKRAQQADSLSLESLQLLLFEKVAEHALVQPTFLVEYPADASPLARRSSTAPHLAERFELFIAGRELVNGFSELNDPQAQAAIFREQAAQQHAGNEEAMHYDADYIYALEHGLPPNAGGGIGVDRLVMLLTDQAAIRDVILFPQLRPE